jgi:death-on-curing protein
MKEPIWLSAEFLRAANMQLVNQFGGLPGPCKDNLLHSALDRPRNLFVYSEKGITIFELAAAYGFGLAKNHPFSDGNKRVAFMAMQTFLDINGWELDADPREVVVVMVDLAASNLEEGLLAVWLKKNSLRLKKPVSVE